MGEAESKRAEPEIAGIAAATVKRRKTSGPETKKLAESDPWPSRPGPKQSEDSDEWPNEVLLALHCAGSLPHLIRAFQDGACFSSDYSGIGCAEEAIRCIQAAAPHWARGNAESEDTAVAAGHESAKIPAALRRHLFGHSQEAGRAIEASASGEPSADIQSAFLALPIAEPGFQHNVRFCRAGDIDANCRSILLSHEGLCASQCVHGDIKDRCQPRIWTSIASDIQRLSKNQATRCSIDPAQFALEAFKIFRRQRLNDKEAYCYKHQKQCPLAPPHGQQLSVHVAGFVCVDWSQMGDKGWLGMSVLPFLQWLCERMTFQEDVVVGENVPQFDVETMTQMVADVYDVYKFDISPSMLGEPVERKRLYLILLHKNKRQWRRVSVAENPHAAFLQLFHRNIMMSPDKKFRAPQTLVKEYVNKLAAASHLPSVSRSGNAWSCYQAMSAARRRALHEHTQVLTEEKKAPHEEKDMHMWLTNLDQQAGYMPPQYGRVPAILRRSSLWLYGKRRLALPQELLEVQGFNLFGSHTCRYKCPAKYIASLSELPESSVRSVAGNSMHVHVLGALLSFVLAETRSVGYEAEVPTAREGNDSFT